MKIFNAILWPAILLFVGLNFVFSAYDVLGKIIGAIISIIAILVFIGMVLDILKSKK